MKSLREYVSEKNSKIPKIYHKSVSYMFRDRDRVDDKVYLSSYGCNLQRDYVWTLEQNRSLVESILIERRIPNITIIAKMDDSVQVIDGKQRLNAYFSFIENLFTIELYGKEYYYKDLPDDYKLSIKYHKFVCDAYVEINDSDLLSDDKILDWFEELNFTGTKLDYVHIENIKAKK